MELKCFIESELPLRSLVLRKVDHEASEVDQERAGARLGQSVDKRRMKILSVRETTQKNSEGGRRNTSSHDSTKQFQNEAD